MSRFIPASQWNRANRNQGEFTSQRDGQARAKKTWKCTACRAEFHVKQIVCEGWPGEKHCGSRTFWKFDSRRELERARALLGMLDRGEIEDLQFHPRYPLVAGKLDGTATELLTTKGRQRVYAADSKYHLSGELVVEDVKGYAGMTDVFELKRDLMRACYGIEIKVVT